jgi:AcrR family transcriptional regulator
MGHKHTREQILDGALQAAVDEGLSQLTFGRLARRLGISDRTVVYYFPTKGDLVTAVILTMGGQLQQVLAEAFKTPAADHIQLARAAWPVLSRPEIDPIFRLFFEANGLAVAGREPFQSLTVALTESWIVWLVDFIEGSSQHRRAEAEAALVVIDGLILLRLLAGPAAADRAAVSLGIR